MKARTPLGMSTQGGNPRRRREPLPIGRTTILTPDITKKVTDAVRAGAYLSVAARYAGISYATMMNWLKRGREASGRGGREQIYRDFVDEIEMAEAAGEVAANLQWRAAWAKDWHAAEKWLQVRYPERYGANRDPFSPTQAFAGVNVQINTGQASSAPSSAPSSLSASRSVPLVTLIEGNPKLLGATMHLFDEIDALYSPQPDDDADDSSAAADIIPYQTGYVNVDDSDVIEGEYRRTDGSDQ